MSIQEFAQVGLEIPKSDLVARVYRYSNHVVNGILGLSCETIPHRQNLTLPGVLNIATTKLNEGKSPTDIGLENPETGASTCLRLQISGAIDYNTNDGYFCSLSAMKKDVLASTHYLLMLVIDNEEQIRILGYS